MSGPERHPANGPAFDERQLRDALAQFATGVTVVCARGADQRYVGFTATSFNSLSLSPPLIVWSLSYRSSSLAAFDAAERYSVNVLSTSQVELARRFSRPHADRFQNVPIRLGWSDAPLIEGCVAWFECRHHARHRIGDHVLFVGEIVTVERARPWPRLPARPLRIDRDASAEGRLEGVTRGAVHAGTAAPVFAF